MADKDNVKAMAEKTGLPEDYVESMLDWEANAEKRQAEVAPMAEVLGMTPAAYLSELEQHQANLTFIASKGFDVRSVKGLDEARRWLETADPDDLMYGLPTGDSFDIQMGSLRRGMLLKSIDVEMRKC